MKRSLALLGFALAVAAGTVAAQDVAPHAIEIPPWFAETFLDFREDIRDAARGGRRLMVYFGQDGCPYCKEFMVTNFSQRTIVEKSRKHFVAIALNLWGDRESPSHTAHGVARPSTALCWKIWTPQGWPRNLRRIAGR